MKKLLKVLEAILCGTLAFIGAICMSPLAILYLLFSLPAAVVTDILDR